MGRKKTKSIEPVVAQLPSEEELATKSATTRRSRTSAKGATSIKPEKPPKNPERNKLAHFILQKYVKQENILYSRDLKFAYKFADKHPYFGFWEYLPVKFQVESMVMLWTPKCKEHLKREFAKYEAKLRVHRSIVIEKEVPLELGEKQGDDFVSTRKKPVSLLQYCKE